VVLGQEAATREVLVCLLARGHILLEGVPGTAKTLLVRTLALALDVRFVRIQFTPDLMPADITGITLLSGAREFTFRPGPVFADLVLADEINRAPAKTQAALLEAMQERTVTVDGTSHPLSPTFTVFATQIRSNSRAPTPCRKPSSIASWSRFRWGTRRRRWSRGF
jgi:MoxR-like ATPase